jgi:predicted transcriptional regulator YdeE
MLDKLKSLAKSPTQGLFGMFSRHYLGTTEYLIAVETDADLPAEEEKTVSHWDTEYPCMKGFAKHKVAACKWVVVENPADESDLDERIQTEWMPSSGYSRAQRSFPTMEFYEKPHGGKAYDQLWVPVDSAADVKRKFEEAKAELAKLEAEKPRGKPVDIDLRTMIPDENAVKEGLQVSYTSDGKMVAFAPTSGNGLVGTPQSFSAPIKIEMRAKTDSTNLRIYYGRSETNYWGAWVHLNGAGNDGEFYEGEDLFINDLAVENDHCHENATRIPVNEFIDVEWVLGKTVMALKINGEIRVASTEYEYIEAFKHGFAVTSPVYPAPGRGSTITVEKLRITEH